MLVAGGCYCPCLSKGSFFFFTFSIKAAFFKGFSCRVVSPQLLTEVVALCCLKPVTLGVLCCWPKRISIPPLESRRPPLGMDKNIIIIKKQKK